MTEQGVTLYTASTWVIPLVGHYVSCCGQRRRHEPSEKKLYPNIDFYSGIALKALGFPTQMFTALFAIARTAG